VLARPPPTPPSPYDADTAQRLRQMEGLLAPRVGTGPAPQAAQAALYALVVRQAMLLAFVDTFRLMSMVVVCRVPIIWVLRRPDRPAMEPLAAP
jgi:hypothetical protein